MLDNYSALKKEIIDKLSFLASISQERKIGSLTEQILNLTQKLENNYFNLVVLGQFKRGKTTFINSLLGTELLPTGVVPLTSIITTINFGREMRAEVFYEDGQRQRISPDEVSLYVTERDNPGNKKGVVRVEVAFPAMSLRDGVRLIDTPGVGSTYCHNTDVAYRILPWVDAGIFITAADPTIGQMELEFLMDIGRYAQKLFFVQNKIDYLSESEQEESLKFTCSVIAEQLHHPGVKLYPLSAKMALEGKLNGDQEKLKQSRLPDFERALADFVVREKGQVLLLSAVNNGIRFARELKGSLEFEREALRTPIMELKQRIEALDDLFARIRAERDNSLYLLRRELKRMVKLLEEDLEEFVKEQVPGLEQELKEFFKSKSGGPARQLANEMFSYLRQRLMDLFDGWRPGEEKKLSQLLEKALIDYARKANGMIDEVTHLVSDLFKVNMEIVHVEVVLGQGTGFYYLVEQLFYFPIEKAMFVLPSGIAQKMVLKQMLAKCQEEVDRNAGRVRYDLLEMMEKVVIQFSREFAGKIDAMMEIVEKATKSALKEQSEGERKLKEREAFLQQQLEALEESLDWLESSKSNLLVKAINCQSEARESKCTISSTT